MNEITKIIEKLQEIVTELFKLTSKTTITSSTKKKVVTQLVKIDDQKKSIVGLMFRKRGKKISARDRILEYLKDNVGQKVSGRELAQVGGISEYARRIRELRHEQGGWEISTGMNRADLKPDEYILESLEQRPVYERMNSAIWASVLERDNFTCESCGWKKGDPQSNNRRFLEVHHKNPVRSMGKPTLDNLITLCNVCHDAREARQTS